MSRDQYSRMRQQFCGMNNFCDARGSIYPKIKIMAVWRQIHHSGHTPPRNHDLPQLCDFPDDVGRGGGHLQVLKKIYRPRVIFKVLGPPCKHLNIVLNLVFSKFGR